jgi:hypothetical protein
MNSSDHVVSPLGNITFLYEALEALPYCRFNPLSAEINLNPCHCITKFTSVLVDQFSYWSDPRAKNLKGLPSRGLGWVDHSSSLAYVGSGFVLHGFKEFSWLITS